MPPEPQPRHGLKARPKLRARPAAPDGPGPAIRQSRASRHSRPASRRDHEPEAPAFALRRVRTTACDRSDARPAFIQRQVSCPRSSAPSCSPPARLSAGPDRSSSLQSVSIPVNSQKQGAPPSDPQFGRAGLCPDSGRDLGCAGCGARVDNDDGIVRGGPRCALRTISQSAGRAICRPPLTTASLVATPASSRSSWRHLNHADRGRLARAGIAFAVAGLRRRGRARLRNATASGVSPRPA